jgi:hypothetical protein
VNLKEMFQRLKPMGTVDLSAVYFSSKYPMDQVNRYYDPMTKNVVDVTKAAGGKRLYRQTVRPETDQQPASFEGSRWLEESV